MKELEFKHVVPYLPYKLKCVWENDLARKMFGDEYQVKDVIQEVTISDYHQLFNPEGHNAKPILCKLSDLSNEDWMEIFKAGMDDDIFESFNEHYDLDVFLYNGVVRLYDANQGFKLWLPEQTLISFCSNQFNSRGVRFDMLAAFNKIFEKHGDLYGLIEGGLVIDINTMEPCK